MKNLKLILFFITGALFVSCDDAIDITQPSELPPDKVYQTIDDMQLGLNGVYASIPGENQIYFTSLFTDEVALGVSNGGQGQDGELAFLLNPATSGDAANMWLENYALINAANRLINGVENVVVDPENEEDTARYNDILAQAHALRAYGHFNLLTFFSEDMKNDNSLGVILVDFVPEDIYIQLPRNTTGEVFDFIDTDLAFAADNLSGIDPATGEAYVNPYFYVTQNFIKAFKARMAAYRGDYATAKTFVDQLATGGGPTLALANKTQYKLIWTDASGQEVIFKINRSNPGGNVTGNFSQFWSSVNTTVTGSPFFEVNRALFNLVNSSSDVRQKVIVDASAFGFPSYVLPDYNSVSNSVYKSRDVLPVGKYPGSEGLSMLNDVKIFRMSEMYLIRAEAYASMNDIPNAIADVNRIRTARIGSSANINPAGLTIQQVWAYILRERRMELAFEGHRYVDLRRLGVLAGQQVDRDPRDCAFNGFCTLPTTDYRFVMPIPRLETAANPNIQQNPNY
ncbi:RagB/SusD family nutrient uptake outer membrane protein [Flavobacterium album]|nr:RagB/SusD family nutrient uptake outer membrane protein [Flavobacterium album]